MIKFTKKYRNYQIGEIAKFSRSHEIWMIQKGVAEEFIPPKEETVAKSTDKDKPTSPGKDPASGNVNKQTVVPRK